MKSTPKRLGNTTGELAGAASAWNDSNHGSATATPAPRNTARRETVSYTHLDVYKRQEQARKLGGRTSFRRDYRNLVNGVAARKHEDAFFFEVKRFPKAAIKLIRFIPQWCCDRSWGLAPQ